MSHERAGLPWVVATVMTTIAAGAAAAAADGATRAYTEWRAQLVRESALDIAPSASPVIVDSVAVAREDGTPSAPTASTPFAPRRLWLAPSTPDPWRGLDKKLHAAASYGAFLTFRLAEDTSAQAALSAFAVGVFKEAHDVWLRHPGPSQGASWRDLVADAAGVAAGALAWSLLAP